MINELLTRVEGLTGPDREVDCRIAVAVDGFFEVAAQWDSGPVGYGYTDKDGSRVEPGHGGDQLVRRYTASIDAALALVERKLPGAEWTRHMDDVSSDGTEEVQIAWREDDQAEWIIEEGVAFSTPLAIITALLRALLAKGE